VHGFLLFPQTWPRPVRAGPFPHRSPEQNSIATALPHHGQRLVQRQGPGISTHPAWGAFGDANPVL
jgi:hypothetical protein